MPKTHPVNTKVGSPILLSTSNINNPGVPMSQRYDPILGLITNNASSPGIRVFHGKVKTDITTRTPRTWVTINAKF